MYILLLPCLFPRFEAKLEFRPGEEGEEEVNYGMMISIRILREVWD